MKVKLITKNGITSGTLETSCNIETVKDIEVVYATIVTSLSAWLGDIQVVKGGFIMEHAQNQKQELVDYLTGKSKEYNAREHIPA